MIFNIGNLQTDLLLGDESPVENDADFKTNPNIHQTVQQNERGEGELKTILVNN